MTESKPPRDKNVITTKEELSEAAVQAFLDGDFETSQHIVDALGQRAKDSQQ